MGAIQATEKCGTRPTLFDVLIPQLPPWHGDDDLRKKKEQLVYCGQFGTDGRAGVLARLFVGSRDTASSSNSNTLEDLLRPLFLAAAKRALNFQVATTDASFLYDDNTDLWFGSAPVYEEPNEIHAGYAADFLEASTSQTVGADLQFHQDAHGVRVLVFLGFSFSLLKAFFAFRI